MSLNTEYAKANVYEGKFIDYLGMLFNYSIPGQVSISMGNMINQFLVDIGVSDDARAESPAGNLFNIDNDAELLNQNDEKFLH